jgi:hypothetical protein
MSSRTSVQVISPTIVKSPYNLPDSPKYISKENIEKITNIETLKEKEKQYDAFLEKKWQVLLLLNQVEEILEIRDAIVIRIIVLEREQKELFQRMLNFISYQ